MDTIFFTCGPTQLYPTVAGYLEEGIRNNVFSVSHRGSQCMEWYEAAVIGLKRLMNIPAGYEVFFISSGTEGMERVIQNCVEKTSGHLVNGVFSKRWMTTSQQLGKQTENFTVPDGQAPNVANANFSNNVELICVTHNETSTGAVFRNSSINKLRKKYPDALIGVDMVSSAPVGEIDFSVADCVIFSVQKGFGLPAGLGVMVVSPRAMAKSSEISKRISVGTYHSFTELKKYADKKQTPETPNVLAIYLLSKIVADLNAIGIEKLRAQTKARAEKLYALAGGILSPFVKDPKFQSITTIVIEVAGGSASVIDKLKAQGIVVSSGYKDYKEKHIRIGNWPAHTDDDFERLMAGLAEISKQ